MIWHVTSVYKLGIVLSRYGPFSKQTPLLAVTECILGFGVIMTIIPPPLLGLQMKMQSAIILPNSTFHVVDSLRDCPTLYLSVFVHVSVQGVQGRTEFAKLELKYMLVIVMQ